jgi:DNA-binding CsgD family transcriptional regulator
MSPSSGPEFTLPETDVRALVRLLGEVTLARGSIQESKEQLMTGLCALIQADAWIWGVGQHNPDAAPFYISTQRGNIDDERFARLMHAVNHPEMEQFVRPFSEELARTGTHLTRLRQQINSDDSFLGSQAEQAWLKAKIGPVMISCKPLPAGGFSSIGIYRNADQPLFSERESRIAHILLSEVPWLHLQAWPTELGESATQLFPRLRTVLNLLIEGWSRKRIAAELGLSIHTVHDYVKAIYEHFGVHSQSELLVRFTKGNGGDTPILGGSGNPR